MENLGWRKKLLAYLWHYMICMLVITFTFIHLADAFIQSDLQLL